MFLELHIIQNFAPSNLNRDDTGAPKDCEFGGFRRARISSQCLKRSIRDAFKKEQLIDEKLLASRTKRLIETLVNRLTAQGKPTEDAKKVVESLLGGAKLKVAEGGKTQYLLFLGELEIEKISDLCLQNWEILSTLAPQSEESGKKKSNKDSKKAAQEAIPPEVSKALLAILDGGKAVDLALFGRMLADLPEKNIDAASQVAHAISTNKVEIEFDFYTAVDDLKPDDTQGADMLGTVEFNSACFYRYANIDLKQLKKNLQGDSELTLKTVEAFVRASISAIPTGKQNSMAAQNPPSFVLVVVRHSGLWSLANAFVKPVKPGKDTDLIESSIKELDEYWGKLDAIYSSDQIVSKSYFSLYNKDFPKLNGSRVNSSNELIEKVRNALSTSIES